jgi:tetratricopeptide (TPR) repeat protein
LRSGNFARAIEEFLPLVNETAHPTAKDVAYLAQLYTQSGRLREAEIWARRALDMAQNNVDYAFMYVAILVEAGKKAKAINELKKLVQFHYQSSEQFEKSSEYQLLT